VGLQIGRGHSLFITLLRVFLISTGTLLCAYLCISSRVLPNGFMIYSGFVGIIGYISIIMAIIVSAAQVPGGAGPAFATIYIVWGVLLLPIWTLVLGIEVRRLKEVKMKDKTSGQRAMLALGESDSENES